MPPRHASGLSSAPRRTLPLLSNAPTPALATPPPPALTAIAPSVRENTDVMMRPTPAALKPGRARLYTGQFRNLPQNGMMPKMIWGRRGVGWGSRGSGWGWGGAGVGAGGVGCGRRWGGGGQG
jgi:hypothetical protein